MKAIWICVSALVLLQSCTSSPVAPPTIEYMDGPEATKVVFEETASEILKNDEVAAPSSNDTDAGTPTDSPSNVAESEIDSMLASNDAESDADGTGTTTSPISSDDTVAVTDITPDANAAADQPEDSPATTSSSVDLS